MSLKKSIYVEDYFVQKFPSGIYHLMFNTTERWLPFHRYNNELYEIGPADGDHYQEIPEGLIPDDGKFQVLTQQCKDQISFYFIPTDMVFRAGEKVIYSSPKRRKKL